MKKIVVFLQNRNFFGAQIVHIPLLKHLKNEYPNSYIYLVSKNKISNILVDLKLADSLIIEKTKGEVFNWYLKTNPDITINLRKNSTFINFYTSVFNLKTRIGFKTFLTKLFYTKTKEHKTGVYRANNYLSLFDNEIKHNTERLENRIVIIPGAGGDYKVWAIENYLDVAAMLREKYNNYEVSFVIGEKEKDFFEQIESQGFKIYYNLNITNLYNIIQNSKLTLANDCGPSHIAQISNSKYLILYSNEYSSIDSTMLEWYNDLGNGDYIVGNKGENINSIEVQKVYDKVISLLND